ncbi:MAG: hypothetical protein WCD38_06780, partial [Candidatus Tumulicola sp.]
SEAMGAYVLWVPDRQLVVVRYVVATPPPPPPPTTAPPPPAPTPAPTPTPQYKDLFIAGDYIISPKVYNEFSPGNTGTNSYAIRGAWEFSALNIPWMIEGSFEQYGYHHDCGSATSTAINPECFVTGIGGGYQTFVPSFQAQDDDVDVRLGVKVLNPRVYVGVGYLTRWNNYGYPTTRGFGFGVEKLPDLDVPLSFLGSFWYYPSVTGNFYNDEFPRSITGQPGLKPATLQLGYSMYKYQAGVDYVIGKSPVFIEAGWMGNYLTNKTNAPANISANGPFVGLGIRF